MKYLLGFCVLILSEVMLAAPVLALDLTAAHSSQPGEESYIAFEYLANKINKSHSGLTMKVFAAGQAGSEKDTVEQVRIGALSMTTVASPVLSTSSALVGVLDIPFLFRDVDHAWAVIDGPIGQKINKQVLKDTGLAVVAWWGSGFRNVFTRNKPVKTPADLSGLKIRVIGSQLYIDTFNTLGAKATPLPYGEVYQALATGVVDGAENESSGYRRMKFYEVAPYYSLTRHFFLFKPVLMYAATLEKMTPAQRKFFEGALAEATTIQRYLVGAENQENLAFVKQHGAKINEVDRDAFQKKLQPVIAKFTEKFGVGLVTAIRNTK